MDQNNGIISDDQKSITNGQQLSLKIQDQNVQPNLQVQSIINESNFKPFTYEIIPEYSISQENWCCAIAINNDCTILLIGCDSQIKVFEFKQGMTKQTQVLSEHKNQVDTLNFMKKSNQFISGSHDTTIIIWNNDENNEWISYQILNGHSSSILCLILNNNEDLIVSGSEDFTIKFWTKTNQWMCQQTITDHSNYVSGLSFNEQQNRLVSCGWDEFILIMEQQGQNKQWTIIQKISVEQFGLRVCFINNNMFTFSPYETEKIVIFETNGTSQQFTKTKDIYLECGLDGCCLFPQQYINSKSILVSKNGQYVNFIRILLNGEFVTEQYIPFDEYRVYGGMSDDGQFLSLGIINQSNYKSEDIKNNEHIYINIIQYNQQNINQIIKNLTDLTQSIVEIINHQVINLAKFYFHLHIKSDELIAIIMQAKNQ